MATGQAGAMLAAGFTAAADAGMDLKSGYPWWAVHDGLPHDFPRLARDLRCDVAVIGAGITGALIAEELASHGHDVAVFEQRETGWGSTAASTALLQYEIDTPMVDLAARYGEADALLAYRACAEAIGMLLDKARATGGVPMQRMHSAYYASARRHVRGLRREYELRARHGFPVRWLDADAVRERLGFHAPAALLSTLAAQVDPYRMCYRLLHKLQRGGTGVYDRTPVSRIVAGARGIELRTGQGHAVRAKHLVVAAGYGGQQLLGVDVARNRSSYALVSDPIDAAQLGALRRTILWETARPYLYLRTTSDHRIIVGGEDDAVDIPARRDARVLAKADRLLHKVGALFPGLPLQPAFSWAGTFAETADGLPFFGPHPKHGPRVHFAMAYGGNGITYSMLGAGLLRALIERRRHVLAPLFSFARLDR